MDKCTQLYICELTYRLNILYAHIYIYIYIYIYVVTHVRIVCCKHMGMGHGANPVDAHMFPIEWRDKHLLDYMFTLELASMESMLAMVSERLYYS